ncbi:polysaccharide transporter, PST family [Flavobacterium resistens]|uniref:Oligosaccharide flippase family protein n=1 Tax=Flavobacterium resistens TaxID=443612 RepID=A0A521DTU0_9FLAO|nr:oligosaccharide flippase family protein [Flavobacterium resistens]MRX68166.1 oligosaccharide flippase family protein [Flavobacterium resistens]SMO75173.1 polysaccharide transporter, PST family [Flavobacterium resistens]
MNFKKIKLNSSLISNFFSLLILQGANYIFPLLTVPYLFRTLGVDTFGLVSFATAFAQYFILLTDFGFNLYGVQYISAKRDDKELRDTFFVNVVVTQLLLFLASLIILFLIIFSFDKFYTDRWLYLLSFGTVFGSVLMPIWFFQGIEQMKYITKINIVTRTLAIVPIFFCVKSEKDFLMVPFFYGLGSIASGVIALYVAKNRFNVNLDFAKASVVGIKECLKESSQFFVSRISVSLYTVSNSFVLGLVLGNAAVGYYAAAEKLYLAIQNVYSPLVNALYPYMVKTKNKIVFKKIYVVVVVINCIVLPICIFNADFILSIIYKNVAIESVTVFKILLGVCMVTIPSILLGYPFLGAFGHAKFTNFTVIVASIFHISILALLLIFNSITIYTVATLVIATESVVLGLRLWGIKKYSFVS